MDRTLKYLAFAVLTVLTACAQPRLDVTRVDSSANPAQVRRNVDLYQGRVVHWGGMIVNLIADGERPMLEILSYPLHNDGNPDEYSRPTGLFRFRYTGPNDISGHLPGRYVTVVGEITGVSGGDPAGNQPIPLVVGDQVFLWGTRYRNDRTPRTTFGFGLGVHF